MLDCLYVCQDINVQSIFSVTVSQKTVKSCGWVKQIGVCHPRTAKNDLSTVRDCVGPLTLT